MSIRLGIKRYNEANGVQMTPAGGYHETMTLFWTCAVSFYLGQAGEARSILALANGMLRLFGNRKLPLEYYTRERLLSWRARTSWLEPDLKPLFLVFIRMIRARHPGYVVYEDEAQVAAEPFRDLRI